MFTVIAHDFTTDFFVGSRDFDSLDAAEAYRTQLQQSQPDTVTVFIQDDEGADL